MKKLTRGRKPVLRSLPPLAEACKGFSGFQPGENGTERMFELLTIVIQRCRRATPQPFYAMREVAKFFGVSRNTVARVYQRLDREGVLTLVRSSQSLIAARAPRPRFAIRGVVCMPIWLPGFLQFLDWRKWFSRLEEELAHYHFVLEPIFFRAEEETSPTFVDRVLRFNPDYVLWSWPNETDRMTMQRIADAGVSLVSIHDADQQFPGRVYRTSYERGLRRGLAEWAASGKIRSVVMPQQPHYVDPSFFNIKSVIKRGSLPCRFDTYPINSISTSHLLSYLRRLVPDRRTGVIFGDDILYTQMCSIAPEGMIEFIRQHRVMVIRQVTIPIGRQAPPPGISVDALIFPWKKLARRIATDLSKSKGIIASGPSILEAEWRSQIPLSGVVQTSCYE